MAKSETKCRWLERRHPRLKKASEFSARIKWIWRTSGKLAEGDYAASLQIVQHAYNRCLTHRGYSTSKAINAAAGYERDGKKVRKAMTIASAGGNCFHDKAAVTSSGRFVLSPLCSTLRACNLLEASPPTMIEWPSVKARLERQKEHLRMGEGSKVLVHLEVPVRLWQQVALWFSPPLTSQLAFFSSKRC